MNAPRIAAAIPLGPLGLPRTYWVLWVGMLVNRLGGGVFSFLSLYLTEARGFSMATAGFIVGLFAAGGTLAGPVGGVLADRLGRKRMMTISTILSAGVMLALGFARTPAPLAMLAALLGFVGDLYRPALHAAVADLVPPPERRRAYGLLYWAFNLGFAGAATLAGALALRNFTAIFVIDALTTLFFAGVVFVAVPETRPEAHARPAGSFLSDLLVPFRDPIFRTFACVQLAVLLVFTQFGVALPLDMRAHGLDAATIGRIIALNGVVIIALQPIVLRLTARTPHHMLLTAGAAFTGVGFAIAALAGGAGTYVVVILVFTLGEIGFSIATPAFIANLASPTNRGGYMGANQLIWGVAGVAAPVTGSFVLEHFGAPVLWLGCGVLGLGAAVLHLTLTSRGHRARDHAG